MSRSPLNGWDASFVGPLAVCINQYFNLLIDEHVLFWFFLVNSFFFESIFNLKFSILAL
jgi:hypothetical protein